MKKILVLLVVLITFLIVIISLFRKENFKNFKISKISVYNIEFSKKDFILLEDYNKILENKNIVKVIDDKSIINEIKKNILNGKEGNFDYAFYFYDTFTHINIPSTPNYLLEIEDFNNNKIYAFIWLYDNQECAFITYFYNNSLNSLNSDKMTNLVINENDTKSLKTLIKE